MFEQAGICSPCPAFFLITHTCLDHVQGIAKSTATPPASQFFFSVVPPATPFQGQHVPQTVLQSSLSNHGVSPAAWHSPAGLDG
jgi:hypothetical protein